MPEEKITFDSPETQRVQKEEEKLRKEGGIVFETEKDPETNKKKNFINILGIKIETSASKEEIQEIKKEIVFSKLDKMLLRRMAECYKLKQPLLIESDPGAGKTYLLHQFIKMIYGKDAPILQINGSPKMNELDILGHWAPNNMDQGQTESYEDFLQNNMMSGRMKQLSEEFSRKMAKINKKLEKGELSNEEFQEEFGKLTTEYINAQQDLLVDEAKGTKFKDKDKNDWHFQAGPLLKAYSGNNGKGFPLLVDEFNLIPSKYQQIFLQISGHDGGLSDSIHFWGNGDKTTYKRGDNTWIVFTSNFPEKTAGRSEVVPPMSDRLVWQVVDNKDFEEKKKSLVLTAGGRLERTKQEVFKEAGLEFIEPEVEDGIQWDKALDEKLGEQIAEIVELLDREFVDYYNKVGDSLEFATGEERRRTQKLEFSSRNALRLFAYLDHFQVRDKKTGEIDFAKTLKMAFNIYYISRLASNDGKEKMKRLFSEILEGDTGKIEIEPNEDQKQELEDLFNKKNQELLEKLKIEKEKIEKAINNVKKAEISDNNTDNNVDIKVLNPKIAKFIQDTSMGVITLLGHKTSDEIIENFNKEKNKRLEKLKKIKKHIVDLLSKLTQYKKNFLNNNIFKGVKTRKEYLEILVKRYKKQKKGIDAPKADIDVNVKNFKTKFSPKVELRDNMNLDRPIVSSRDKTFKAALELIFKSLPIELFIINLGDLNSTEDSVRCDTLKRKIQKDISNIKKIKTVQVPVKSSPLFNNTENSKKADKETEKGRESVDINQLESNIKIILDNSSSNLYKSINEIFEIYKVKKIKENIDSKTIQELLGKKSFFTKETREYFIKNIKANGNNFIEILKEFLDNRLQDDINIKRFLNSSAINYKVWKDYKQKLDKVKKIIEKGGDIPIVLTKMVREESLKNELEPQLSRDMIKRLKKQYNSYNLDLDELLGFLEIPKLLRELSKKENVFLEDIGSFDVSEVLDKVVENYIENMEKNERVSLYSLNYEFKKIILDMLKDNKKLKQKIINEKVSIIDAVCFDNLYNKKEKNRKDNRLGDKLKDEEEDQKEEKEKIKKNRFMRFFSHFVEKEGPIVILANNKFKEYIQQSKLFDKIKKSGREIHFINSLKPEQVLENMKNIL